MKASVAIQLLPQGVQGNDEVVRVVDEVIAYIRSEFPDAYVGPFETAIEGDYDHCMEVLAEASRVAVRAGSAKVAVYSKIFFDANDNLLTTEQKTAKYNENDA